MRASYECADSLLCLKKIKFCSSNLILFSNAFFLQIIEINKLKDCNINMNLALHKVFDLFQRFVNVSSRDKHYSPLGAQASNTFDFNTFWFAAHSKRSFHCWLCRKTSEVYNSLILSFYSFNPCFCNFSFFLSILTKQTDLIKINNFSERMTQIFNILRE